MKKSISSFCFLVTISLSATRRNWCASARDSHGPQAQHLRDHFLELSLMYVARQHRNDAKLSHQGLAPVVRLVQQHQSGNPGACTFQSPDQLAVLHVRQVPSRNQRVDRPAGFKALYRLDAGIRRKHVDGQFGQCLGFAIDSCRQYPCFHVMKHLFTSLFVRQIRSMLQFHFSRLFLSMEHNATAVPNSSLVCEQLQVHD